MNAKKTKGLLSGLPLCNADAARLVLEALEEMPELHLHAVQGKPALMQALRRMLRRQRPAAAEEALCPPRWQKRWQRLRPSGSWWVRAALKLLLRQIC